MRRFLFVAVLLGRFCGSEYVWTARRPRRPVPIERRLPDEPEGAALAWWLLP